MGTSENKRSRNRDGSARQAGNVSLALLSVAELDAAEHPPSVNMGAPYRAFNLVAQNSKPGAVAGLVLSRGELKASSPFRSYQPPEFRRLPPKLPLFRL
jgi:hypothetical protein